MARIRTWLFRLTASLIVLVAGLAAFVYTSSEQMLRQRYPVAADELVVSPEGATRSSRTSRTPI